MPLTHHFVASLYWDCKNIDMHNPRSQKSHQVSIIGKKDLHISAAKAFKGDPQLHNPEDLLLSSLMSCHLMSYQYVCSKHNVTLLTYSDTAEAILETLADGSGRITAVHLYPMVELKDVTQKELALSLHKEANKLCFIANSCNFPVYHHPSVKV